MRYAVVHPMPPALQRAFQSALPRDLAKLASRPRSAVRWLLVGWLLGGAPGCGSYRLDSVCREHCAGDLACQDECVARSTSRLRDARALGCEAAFTRYLGCLYGDAFSEVACRAAPRDLHACGVDDPVGPTACVAEDILERSLRSSCGDDVDLVPTPAESSCSAPLGPVEVACRLACRLKSTCDADTDMSSCEDSCVAEAPGV